MVEITRRETLRRGFAASTLLAMLPEWSLPALAQDETDVPFTDLPRNFNPSANLNGASRQYDIRTIDGMLTPKDRFFTTQHMTKPEIDPEKYRLKFSGMVTHPTEFSLSQLKAMKPVEMVAGFECSGNSARAVEALSSCGRFKGVPLSAVLKQVGVHPKAREVVFLAPTTLRPT